MEQPRFERADLGGQFLVALGGARLPPQLGRALLLLAEDFAQPGEVGLGRAKLLLGVLAPRVKPGNARRLLEQKAPFDRLGRNDRADLALADQRRRMRARRRVGEQQGDILGADVAAVDPVGGAGAALDPPRDVAFARPGFIACVTVEQHRHFGEIALRARRGAGEDHVVHPAAAKRLGAALAHDPADRLEQVRFAAAVGPDDPGQAGLDPELGQIRRSF